MHKISSYKLPINYLRELNVRLKNIACLIVANIVKVRQLYEIRIAFSDEMKRLNLPH